MLTELHQKKNLFSLLYRIDYDLSQQFSTNRCPFCGGPLHFSNYSRKPRGGPEDLPDEYLKKFSMCCGREGCRRRTNPPTCRFLERKVYWQAVMMIIMTLKQNRQNPFSINKLKQLFGVSRKTIKRWALFYRDIFPQSNDWRYVRGLISAVVSNNKLPGELVNYFIEQTGSAIEAVVSTLIFLIQAKVSTKFKGSFDSRKRWGII